jgi:cell division protein FtsI/penicillin-binding protein 2
MKYKILRLVFLPVNKHETYKEKDLNANQKSICELYNSEENCDEFENKEIAIKAVKMLKLKWPAELFTIKEFI